MLLNFFQTCPGFHGFHILYLLWIQIDFDFEQYEVFKTFPGFHGFSLFYTCPGFRTIWFQSNMRDYRSRCALEVPVLELKFPFSIPPPPTSYAFGDEEMVAPGVGLGVLDST